MSWSAWAIQNRHAHVAGKYMNFSPDAVDGSAGAPLVIYPWQLETLVNEALLAPPRFDARGRKLVTQNFSAIYRLAKLIQRIEEADDRAFLESNDVLYELHRLTQRQFEWQRGFANMPRFYRTLEMFGEGAPPHTSNGRLAARCPRSSRRGSSFSPGRPILLPASGSGTRLPRG